MRHQRKKRDNILRLFVIGAPGAGKSKLMDEHEGIDLDVLGFKKDDHWNIPVERFDWAAQRFALAAGMCHNYEELVQRATEIGAAVRLLDRTEEEFEKEMADRLAAGENPDWVKPGKLVTFRAELRKKFTPLQSDEIDQFSQKRRPSLEDKAVDEQAPLRVPIRIEPGSDAVKVTADESLQPEKKDEDKPISRFARLIRPVRQDNPNELDNLRLALDEIRARSPKFETIVFKLLDSGIPEFVNKARMT